MVTQHRPHLRRTTGLAVALPLVVAALGATPAGAAEARFDSPQAPHVVSARFAYSGAPETFTVPAGVTSVTLSATGAAGGDSAGDIDGGTSTGGRGALVEGTLAVSPGQVIQVRVGGAGGDAGSLPGGTGLGGWNGGGDGGAAQLVGAGGGGATELRDCTMSCDGLSSRLVVAGGGGGAGFTQGPNTADGGDAAAKAEDYDDVRGPVTGGEPGNFENGGAGGVVGSDFDRISSGGAGSAGQGGVGGGLTGPDVGPNASPAYRGAGGGGGGWFGGGGGGDNRYYGAGGGGGSSVAKDGMTVGLAAADAPAEVVLTYDLGPVTDLAVDAADDVLPASGAATTVLTATATTAGGVGINDLDVSFSSTDPGQTFGPVTDQGDGTYTVDLHGSTTVGDATVTATADGDPDVIGTTTVTTVAYDAPAITAELSSARPPANGWYRTPVTVTFACTGSRVVLCPDPVTEAQNGRDQEVTGGVFDDQGGADTVTVTFSIDRLKPVVKVTGARNGATYGSARKLTCKASDTLSGVKSCKVTTTKKKTVKGTVVTWTGRALDKAGNSSVTKGKYTIRKKR